MDTDQRPTTENHPSSKTARPRKRTRVPNEEKQILKEVKNKTKTPLTRPASLEMTPSRQTAPYPLPPGSPATHLALLGDHMRTRPGASCLASSSGHAGPVQNSARRRQNRPLPEPASLFEAPTPPEQRPIEQKVKASRGVSPTHTLEASPRPAKGIDPYLGSLALWAKSFAESTTTFFRIQVQSEPLALLHAANLYSI